MWQAIAGPRLWLPFRIFPDCLAHSAKLADRLERIAFPLKRNLLASHYFHPMFSRYRIPLLRIMLYPTANARSSRWIIAARPG